jgi:Na+/H+-dicarboxylate symporter|tara:strand:- start:1781 stop:3004 length:1224 start_codon:yes stop_codon:yes gene_type:complete
MKTLFQKYFNITLSTRILIWMVLGAVAGISFGKSIVVIKPLGDLFIQLLMMVAIPLVFFNLLAGLTSMSNIKSMGKTAIKVFVFYLTTTTIAITLGMGIMFLFKAGVGFEVKADVTHQVGEAPPLLDLLLNMFPTNIFKSFAEGNLIQIVVFGIMVGIASLAMPKEKKEKLEKAYNLIAELMRKLVDLVMRVAPICLAALIAASVGEYGSEIFGPIIKFILAVFSAQVLMVGFYMLLLMVVGKVSPRWFLQNTKELYATTIATCSSLASLAVSLDVAESKLKLPKSIYGFTLPLGAQFNKDGTSIMLSAVLIFTAQAVGWTDMTIWDLLQIVIVGLIIVEGSGGIPGGGLVVAMLFAKAFDLPIEVVAVIGGIYRFIDMGNTTVNCMGDLVATVIIAKQDTNWEPDN